MKIIQHNLCKHIQLYINIWTGMLLSTALNFSPLPHGNGWEKVSCGKDQFLLGHHEGKYGFPLTANRNYGKLQITLDLWKGSLALTVMKAIISKINSLHRYIFQYCCSSFSDKLFSEIVSHSVTEDSHTVFRFTVTITKFADEIHCPPKKQ